MDVYSPKIDEKLWSYLKEIYSVVKKWAKNVKHKVFSERLMVTIVDYSRTAMFKENIPEILQILSSGLREHKIRQAYLEMTLEHI